MRPATLIHLLRFRQLASFAASISLFSSMSSAQHDGRRGSGKILGLATKQLAGSGSSTPNAMFSLALMANRMGSSQATFDLLVKRAEFLFRRPSHAPGYGRMGNALKHGPTCETTAM